MGHRQDGLGEVVIVAWWRCAGICAGRSGAWGWALGADWGLKWIGEPAWSQARERCASRIGTHHGVAIEDEFFLALGYGCQTAQRAGLPLISASVGASGEPGARQLLVTMEYRQSEKSGARAKKARAEFFAGMPACFGEWVPSEIEILPHERLRLGLDSARQAWQDKLALEESCALARLEDSGVSRL